MVLDRHSTSLRLICAVGPPTPRPLWDRGWGVGLFSPEAFRLASPLLKAQQEWLQPQHIQAQQYYQHIQALHQAGLQCHHKQQKQQQYQYQWLHHQQQQQQQAGLQRHQQQQWQKQQQYQWRQPQHIQVKLVDYNLLIIFRLKAYYHLPIKHAHK